MPRKATETALGSIAGRSHAVTTRRTPNVDPAGCRYACRRCNHHWNARHPEQAAYLPRMCPCCGSAYWNAERKRKAGK